MAVRAAVLETVYTADTRQADAAARKIDQGLGKTGQVAQATGGRFRGAFSTMGRAVTGLGGHLASAGIGLALNGFAEAASGLGEVVDFTSQVFKENAAEMEAWGGTTLDTIGAAKVTALDAANGFGVLFNAADLTGEKSVELSQAMVQLAGDMSSAKDVELEESLTAIRSGLVGESEPLRRFGILLNEAAVQEEALRSGLVEAGEELTEGAKTQARVNLILQEGAVYNGNYADTAESMANQQRKASQAALEAKAALGEELAPIMAEVYETAGDLAGGLAEMGPGARKAVVGLMGFGAALPYIVRTGQAIGIVGSGLVKLAKSKAVADTLSAAAGGLGTTARLAGGGIGALSLATGAYVGVAAAAVVAVKTWSAALAEAKKAAEAVEKSTESSENLIGAWGQQLEAGIITQDEFNRKVEALMPAAHKAQDGIGGLIDQSFSFVRGEKTAAEVTEERKRITERAKAVTDGYAQAQKQATRSVVRGAEEQRTATVRSLKSQWKFLDMNLEKYGEWADGTKAALNGVQGSLGDLASRSRLTARGMNRAFGNQLEKMKTYAADWGEVLDRGIAKKAPELTQQIQEMGIEGAGIVKALAGANKEEFGAIIDQWNQAQTISDRTSRAVVRHTATWRDKMGDNMRASGDSVEVVTEKLEQMKGVIADLGNVEVKVTGTGLQTGAPTVAGQFGGSSFAMGQRLLGMFPGLQITSMFRPGDDGFHGDPANPAVDLAAAGWPSDTSGIPNAQAMAVFQAAVGMFGANIREAIYGTMIYERGRMGYYSGGDHWGHVHLAKDGLVALRPTLAMMAEAGGGEAAVPLGSGRGRRELSRALAMAGAGGRGGTFTGTVRIIGLEEGVLELTEDGIDNYDAHRRRRDRAGAN